MITETIEYRAAQEVLDVHFPERIIDMIAVPYDEEAPVVIRGRPVRESVDPAAFAGVFGSVSVNRAHDVERPLGKVVAFHPGDKRGLRTEIRITPRLAEGDDVLALAADGLLQPSVGFVVLPGGERWTADRSARRVTKAALRHIGLTGEGAYRGAQVLDVRHASGVLEDAGLRSATPNLDRIRLELAAERAGLTLPGSLSGVSEASTVLT